MKKFLKEYWFLLVFFPALISRPILYYAQQKEQENELAEDAKLGLVRALTTSEEDTFTTIPHPPVPDPNLKDTVVFSYIKNKQTGKVCRINRTGQIIDTFTVVPVFDSILINHSKIPDGKNARKKRHYKSQ